jgi:hypothetical protein
MRLENNLSIATVLFAVGIFTLVSPTFINAQSATPGKIKNEIRPEQKLSFKNKPAKIIDAQVATVSGNTLTVSKDGKTYTVNTNSGTLFRRHFWGKSAIGEISPGDNISIWGTWADDAQTTVNARMVRDTSIMKRYGVFIGPVKSKDTGSFVISILVKGDQTVYFDAKTKFIDRSSKTIKYDSLTVGDRVRVKGLWDKTLSKITEVTQIKDFSLPIKPTPTITK